MEKHPAHARGEHDRLVREALEEAGLSDALEQALAEAGLSAVPDDAVERARFLETTLLDAMVGRVHPTTARSIVDGIVDGIAAAIETTRRSERPPEQAATVPPPPLAGAADTYLDLATGAVHTRPTPTWGLRRDGEAIVPAVWLLVSSDEALIELAERAAPVGTEVLHVSSMAVLKGALARSDGPASCVVLDAAAPSISFDRAVAAVTEEASAARVLLWRMPEEARANLVRAVPVARTWVAFEAEVTPSEIVQLLGA